MYRQFSSEFKTKIRESAHYVTLAGSFKKLHVQVKDK
jgi:hypothetical protein